MLQSQDREEPQGEKASVRLPRMSRRLVIVATVAVVAIIGNGRLVNREKNVVTSYSKEEPSIVVATSFGRSEYDPLNLSSQSENVPIDETKQTPEQTAQVDQKTTASPIQNNSSIPLNHKRLSLSAVQEQYPHCFVQGAGAGRGSVYFLNKVRTKFVTDVNRRAPYDHESCFLMKARYSCAVLDGTKGPQAFHHKLQFQDKKRDENASTSWCDLDHVVDWIGGPAGVGRILQQKHNLKGKPYRVLIQGNSQLRQVFESLICRYGDQMTQLTVAMGGPKMALEEINKVLKARNRTNFEGIFTIEDMAKPLHVLLEPKHTSDLGDQASISLEELQRRGCHSVDASEMPSFYHENITVPSSWAGCTDDFGMVQFGDSIRIYYIFRPNFYDDDAIEELYRRIGMAPLVPSKPTARFGPVDAAVVNEDSMSNVRFLKESRRLAMGRLVPHLNTVQMNQWGYFHGANNPFIDDPPDSFHPCMPGMPEDEANLLLYGLMTDRS